MATATNRTNTNAAPLTDLHCWIALGADEDKAKRPTDAAYHARNAKLWLLNEAGALMFTPDAQERVEAFLASEKAKQAKAKPSTRKATNGAKPSADAATILKLVSAGFTKDEALAMLA